jgi:hypothetical protein
VQLSAAVLGWTNLRYDEESGEMRPSRDMGRPDVLTLLLDARVVKSTKVRNPICTTLLLTENFIFQWPKECAEVVGHPVRHKTPESNKSHPKRVRLARKQKSSHAESWSDE